MDARQLKKYCVMCVCVGCVCVSERQIYSPRINGNESIIDTLIWIQSVEKMEIGNLEGIDKLLTFHVHGERWRLLGSAADGVAAVGDARDSVQVIKVYFGLR